jgi:hypothetical protein
MKIRIAIYFMVAGIICAGSSLADSGYVRRPQGWFLVAPPLTKPDSVNGKRYVDKSAPEKRWFAVVIQGSDGQYYDFANQNRCDAWKNAAIVKFSKFSKTLPLLWVGRSKCPKDDGRHRITTYEQWEQMMQKYQDRQQIP